jgi:hypothetical protein
VECKEVWRFGALKTVAQGSKYVSAVKAAMQIRCRKGRQMKTANGSRVGFYYITAAVFRWSSFLTPATTIIIFLMRY